MIGIDVGGANLKVVDDDGARIHYCPLYEEAPLTDLLEPYAKDGSFQAAVVMSGELADCFSDKMQGIRFIVDAVREVFPGAMFYGTDAIFHTGAVQQLAAANWLASADFLRERYPDAVLVDMGSTTTDIIPLSMFDRLKGLTDLLRLQRGYLVYTGMLRTTIPAVLRTVKIDSIETPVSSEYFATSADAHLVLGHIGANEYSCETPDKKGKTKEAALCRLARVVCSDLAEIGKKNATGIAAQFWETQRTLICNHVESVAGAAGASSVITAGIGSALVARELGGTDLARELGPVSDALPAYAVREVALRRNRPVKHYGSKKG
ncbi:MAG: Hydantoinase/oxoprolinase [Methanoregula sp. PtaU1.Bin051]|nr:MAG: Hydantoinase/oxoprolinase [Methanoregula sp. PtaU1.Bin051]